MNLNSNFFTLILAQFFYLFLGSQIYATAPTSLGGTKIQATFEDQERGVYINLDSSGYVLEDGICSLWKPHIPKATVLDTLPLFFHSLVKLNSF